VATAQTHKRLVLQNVICSLKSLCLMV